MHLRTPLLVDVSMTPAAYLQGLSKPARKNYRVTEKQNAGLQFKEVPYDPGLVREFMALWETQRVNGHNAKWIFHPNYFDHLARHYWLRTFVVEDGGTPIALHPVEQFGNFSYTQPVLYDKNEHPQVAKWVWFNLMLWACAEQTVHWIDLGGGFHGSWRNFLGNRSDPAFRYKWRFVSKKVKDEPENQPEYFAQRCDCGYKQLVERVQCCPGCGSGCSS